MYNQNLAFVKTKTESYFVPLDKYVKALFSVNVGKFENGDEIIFNINRGRRFLLSPVLTGYLAIQPKNILACDENKIEILFEFPEVLISRQNLLMRVIDLRTKFLESRYSLKRIADDSGPYKDDFGEWGYWEKVSYEQSGGKYFGCDFNIQK